MRDGVRLALDVYRPDGPGPFPVLYAAALHNKDMQGPDMAECCRRSPRTSRSGLGRSKRVIRDDLSPNGYVHVIAQPRGSAKSEGHYGHENTDHYDMIDWISQQSWCDGKVGMVGISGYAGEQWRAAAQGHPALKAIFPYDACSAYGGMFGFRDFYPGRRPPHLPVSSRRLQHGARTAWRAGRPACRSRRRCSARRWRIPISRCTSISTTS